MEAGLQGWMFPYMGMPGLLICSLCLKFLSQVFIHSPHCCLATTLGDSVSATESEVSLLSISQHIMSVCVCVYMCVCMRICV